MSTKKVFDMILNHILSCLQFIKVEERCRLDNFVGNVRVNNQIQSKVMCGTWCGTNHPLVIGTLF